MKFPKFLKYVLIFAVIFTFGWESSSYYLIHKTAAGTQNIDESEVSPVAALTSLINSSDKPEADLTIFWQVWGMLSESYVDETALNKQKMVYGAIKGMVSALDDPFTSYMTPDETKEFDQSLNGELEGIGAELTVREGSLVVVTPLKDSPAEKAGLQPGDIVYKIDGALTSELTLFDAIMKIRGEKGTNVTLTIVRGEKEPFDVVLTRDKVNVESVSVEEKDDGVYYISINQFNDSTKPEFEDILKDVILHDPKGVVLDLRNNGGGYLDISVDILSELLPGQIPAVTIKRRLEEDNETLYVSGAAKLATVPMVVLINDGTASASEIVAGAIQDHKRGIIMGETSFGKGSVQEVAKLPDDSSLRMTIAKWYTPNGKSIDHVGITPDIEVKFTDEDAESGKDPQLDAAVKYLKDLQ